MTNYTQAKEFKNAIDVKDLALQITSEYYPEVKLMETIQEYREGCRQSDILALIKDEHLGVLAERVAQYGSEAQYDEVKAYLMGYVIENNLIDEEELYNE